VKYNNTLLYIEYIIIYRIYRIYASISFKTLEVSTFFLLVPKNPAVFFFPQICLGLPGTCRGREVVAVEEATWKWTDFPQEGRWGWGTTAPKNSGKSRLVKYFFRCIWYLFPLVQILECQVAVFWSWSQANNTGPIFDALFRKHKEHIYVYVYIYIYRQYTDCILLTLKSKSPYIRLQDWSELLDFTFRSTLFWHVCCLMSVRQLKFGLKFCGVLLVYITTATREDSIWSHLKLKRRLMIAIKNREFLQGHVRGRIF